MTEDTILAYLIRTPAMSERLLKAKLNYFTGINRSLYTLVKLHYQTYDLAPTLDSMTLLLKQRHFDREKARDTLKKFMLLGKMRLPNIEPWDIDRFYVESEDRIMAETLLLAGEALQGQVEVRGKVYAGAEGARQLLDGLSAQVVDTNDDVDPMAAYKRRQTREEGLCLGILNSLVGDAYPGEEIVLAGYTGEGKTTLAMNFTRECFLMGRPVLYLSLEVPNYQIYWRLVSMESACNGGLSIPYYKIKTGKLNQEEEITFSRLTSKIKETVEVISMPIGVGAPTLTAFCRNKFKKRYYPLVILDYAGFAASEAGLGKVFREMKTVAKSLNTISLVLHQMNREGWKEAVKTGRYSLTALSETWEAERTADVVVWILKLAHLRSRVGVSKYRDEARDLTQVSEVSLDPESYIYTLKDSLQDVQDLASIGMPPGMKADPAKKAREPKAKPADPAGDIPINY